MAKSFLKLDTQRQDILFIIIIFLFSSLFFWRIFFPEPKIFATAEIGVSDIWNFNYPLKNFLHESLQNNKLPLWNWQMGSGFPVLAEGQIGAFNFYNLLAFKYLPTIYAFNLGYVFIFLQTAIGTYLFCRRIFFAPVTAFFGALTFSFSGFFITHISHYMLIQASSFLPWILLFTHEIMRKPTLTKVTLLTFTLSQQIFSGFPQLVFITFLGIVGYILFYLILHKFLIIRKLLIVCTALVAGVVISASQILPTFELLKISNRASSNVLEVLKYTYPPVHMASMIYPYVFGNPQRGTYPHFSKFQGSLFWENTSYMGLLPLFLCLYIIIKRYRERNLQLLVGAIGISMLLMFGGSGPLYFLYTFQPFSLFRFASRFSIWFIFLLMLLACLSLEEFKKRLVIRIKKKAAFLIGMLLMLHIVNILFFWFDYHPTVKYTDFIKASPAVEYLKTRTSGNIYTFEKNKLALGEFFQSGSAYPERYISIMGNEIPPNLNLLHDLTTVDSYAALVPKRIGYYNASIESSYHTATKSGEINPAINKLLTVRNVNYVLSTITLSNRNLQLEKSVNLNSYNQSILNIYRKSDSLPKYYLVDQTVFVQSLEDFSKKFFSNEFDPHKSVIVEKPVTVSNKQELTSQITPLTENQDNLKLKISTNGTAILVITNSYYPGWIATVDDQTAQIFPVNLINQGILLTSGNHNVNIKFQPDSVKSGLIITVIGYVILIFLLGKTLKKPRITFLKLSGKVKGK